MAARENRRNAVKQRIEKKAAQAAQAKAIAAAKCLKKSEQKGKSIARGAQPPILQVDNVSISWPLPTVSLQSSRICLLATCVLMGIFQGAGSSTAMNATSAEPQQSQANKRRRPNTQDPIVTPNEGIPTVDEDLLPVLSPEDPVHFCLLSKALKFWI